MTLVCDGIGLLVPRGKRCHVTGRGAILVWAEYTLEISARLSGFCKTAAALPVLAVGVVVIDTVNWPRML